MSIESQFTQIDGGAKKDARIEDEKFPRYLSVEAAIKMYEEKKLLMNKLKKNIEDISENDDSVLRNHDIIVQIHKICFVDVEQSELIRHVMHRVISGATIMAEMEKRILCLYMMS